MMKKEYAINFSYPEIFFMGALITKHLVDNNALETINAKRILEKLKAAQDLFFHGIKEDQKKQHEKNELFQNGGE